jgi:hypothetical protein
VSKLSLPKAYGIGVELKLRDAELVPLKPPSNYKTKDAIDKWMEENRTKILTKAMEVPSFGWISRVLILSVEGDEYKTHVDTTDFASEALVTFLEGNWPDEIHPNVFVGYDIKSIVKLAVFEELQRNVRPVSSKIWFDRSRLSAMPDSYLDPLELFTRSLASDLLTRERVEDQLGIPAERGPTADKAAEDAMSALSMARHMWLVE